MSVPDISLLVPLAEQLNVTVAELLHGCRVEEEQRFTREETEELIRKALTFSAEPPERRQARTQKFLPLYGVSVVLGLVETAAVWAVGLAGTEGAMMLLIIQEEGRSSMRDDHIDLCGQIDFTRTEAMPLLARDAHFSFACNGCGDCCRGREDIVLSGFDLWRIAARLRLPPQIVARGYCRASIGTVSHLPVLRLAPVKENRNNCPFLTGDHCAIHDAEPLVCALYPLAQEISRKGQVSYFLQPTGCGGQVIEARVEDYLACYDVPAREQTDVRWAQTCMTLEDTVEQLGAQLSPVLVRRMQDKLWQALYFGYDYAAPFLPQLEKNLHWLDAEFAKLTEYQQKRNNASK